MRWASRYLERDAEPEVAEWEHFEGLFDRGVVVPVCDELEGLPRLIGTLAEASVGQTNLAIIVLNGRHTAPESVHRANALTLDWLHRWSHPRLRLLVVDSASEGRRFSKKDGVGRARKIGMDIALSLFVRGQWREPAARFTDADALVPVGYFRPIPSGLAGGFYPYAHAPLFEEMALYELRLRSYPVGLRWAGSPYAFPTIGSTLAVSFRAYAQVQGVPKRQAGEDFYLLNKLAKVGPIGDLGGEPIVLSSRVSSRVPFGTGPALKRLLQGQSDASFYDPRVYERLRLFLVALKRSVQTRDLSELRACSMGWEPGWTKLQRVYAQGVPDAVLETQLGQWMDGFRTLKLVHHLQRTQWPAVGWRAGLRADFFPEITGLKTPEEALRVWRLSSTIRCLP